MFGSAISLSAGGILLYAKGLVPVYLTEITVVAVVVLLILGYLVFKGNMLAVNISTILGVIAPIFSASTPAHLGVLADLGHDLLLTVLGLLQFFGFYVFPIAFVILRIGLRKKLRALTTVKPKTTTS